MRKKLLVTASALAVALAMASANADLPAASTKKVDYVTDVKPILKDRCWSCHGVEKQKGKLRLDSREAAIKGGDAGTSIVPGKADKSEFYKRIVSTDRMFAKLLVGEWLFGLLIALTFSSSVADVSAASIAALVRGCSGASSLSMKRVPSCTPAAEPGFMLRVSIMSPPSRR